MTELQDIQDLLHNETALAAFLKKVHDDQRSLEQNTDILYILLNAIIVYCKCAAQNFRSFCLFQKNVQGKNQSSCLLTWKFLHSFWMVSQKKDK